MDIQVTFEDGTTETRPAWSPCIADVFEPNLRHPSEEQWYHYFPEDRRLPLLFCGRSVRRLSDWRGGGALVWRITGQDDITKALTGEWQSCRVETADAQIERLTRERDAARRAALLWKGFAREFWKEAQEAWGVFRRLRDAARGACDREMGDGHRYPEGVKVSTLVAHLNTMFSTSVDAREPFAHPDRDTEPAPAMSEGSVWCWASVAQDMHEGRGYPLGAAECPEVAALRHALYWAKIASFRDGDRFTVCAAWSDGHDEFEIEVSATEAPSAWGLRARIV